MPEMKKLNPDWIKFVLLRISEIPPMFDAITGVSHARLSSNIVGTPSNREVISITLL